MADGPDNLRKGRSEKPVELVESLANEALRTLAQQRVPGPVVVSEHYIDRLHAAAIERGARARHTTL